MRKDIINHAIENVVRRVAEQKDQAVKEAIIDGYDGIDFVQPDPPTGLDGAMTVSVDPRPWNAPPPENTSGNRVERYDFRYYDRPTLVHMAKNGEWPYRSSTE